MTNDEAIEAIVNRVENLYRDMRDRANLHTEFMHGLSNKKRSDYVKTIIDNADIVFGIFPDQLIEDGFGTHIIKGRNLMTSRLTSLNFSSSEMLRVDAVPCNDQEQAIVAERTYGLH